MYKTFYYVGTDIYARFFSHEKPFRDLFLRALSNQNHEMIFSHVKKPFRPISASLCLHSSESAVN